MKFDVEQAIEVLDRTPHTLRGMLQGIGDGWAMSNYGTDTFSPFDVVGHLIHGERTDWIPRMRVILEHGPTRPFDPFDRYAMHEASKNRSLDSLLDEFERLREENIAALREAGINTSVLSLRGTHPALGVVTLENLLATWVVHDLNHIAQIAKAMAYQYLGRVGPWREYLSILKAFPA